MISGVLAVCSGSESVCDEEGVSVLASAGLLVVVWEDAGVEVTGAGAADAGAEETGAEEIGAWEEGSVYPTGLTPPEEDDAFAEDDAAAEVAFSLLFDIT